MGRFSGEVLDIPSEVQLRMAQGSWRDAPECPPFEALRLLRLAHFDFRGDVKAGELVVAASIAPEVLAIFERLFAARFPIERMQRMDAYSGSDDAAMADNNTSCFNFRYVDGTRVLSRHALGLAIDINPVQNPWVREGRVDPALGRAYLDRSDVRPGMIVPSGPVVLAFAELGWEWGGSWKDADYHHFSKLPR